MLLRRGLEDEGLGLRVWGLGFVVWGSGFRIQVLRVKWLVFSVSVYGLGLGVFTCVDLVHNLALIACGGRIHLDGEEER